MNLPLGNPTAIWREKVTSITLFQNITKTFGKTPGRNTTKETQIKCENLWHYILLYAVQNH